MHRLAIGTTRASFSPSCAYGSRRKGAAQEAMMRNSATERRRPSWTLMAALTVFPCADAGSCHAQVATPPCSVRSSTWRRRPSSRALQNTWPIRSRAPCFVTRTVLVSLSPAWGLYGTFNPRRVTAAGAADTLLDAAEGAAGAAGAGAGLPGDGDGAGLGAGVGVGVGV